MRVAVNEFAPTLVEMLWQDGDATETMGDEVNDTLDDVIRLLEAEIERLKESLETHRLINHSERRELIRWHVRALDERQDTLDSLKSMIEATDEKRAVH